MPLILRSSKGSPLSISELDGNFTFITGSIDDLINGTVTVASASYAVSASHEIIKEISSSHADFADVAATANTASYVQASSIDGAITASYINTLTQNVTISGSILVSGSIIPNVNGGTTSSFSLGSPTAAWKDIYVSNGTINFIDGNGNVQGTLGAGTNATVITGSLQVVQVNPLTNYGFDQATFEKSVTHQNCVLDLSDGNIGQNPSLYTLSSNVFLPWDKKYTSFSLYNSVVSSSFNPSNTNKVSLPPIYNSGYNIGEIITVYNLTSGSISGIEGLGDIELYSQVQGITAVNTGNKTITSFQNTGQILSGSWGNYTFLTGNNNTITVSPGQKATFEIIYWGTTGTTPYPPQTFPTNGYATEFTTANTFTYYLFKGIENL